MTEQPSETKKGRWVALWVLAILALAFTAGSTFAGAAGTTDTEHPRLNPLSTATPSSAATYCTGWDGYTVSTAVATVTPGIVDTGNHCDDCVTSIELPFTFYFYGWEFNTAFVSSNGNLQFLTANPEPVDACRLTSSMGSSIYPYWDDLVTAGSSCPGGPCGIYTSVTGTAPNRVFHIEWRATYHRTGGGAVNFEIQLFEGLPSRFSLVYAEVGDQGASATIGAQSYGATRFFFYSCDLPALRNGLAINYTAPPCATPTPCNALFPTWTPASALSPARYGVQGGLASDGNPRFTPIVSYYVVGGLDGQGNPIPDVGRYVVASNYWAPSYSLPAPIGKAAVAGDGSRVYEAGGYIGPAGSVVTNTARYMYPFTSRWNDLPPLPQSLEGGAGVMLNGYFYVLGGDDSTHALSTLYRFSITNQSWSAMAPLPVPRTNAAATAYNGVIYLFGGQDGNNQPVDTLFVYDPAANTWATLASADTGGYGNFAAITPYGTNRLLATAAVGQNARNLRHFRNPAAVGFLLGSYGQRYGHLAGRPGNNLRRAYG